MNLIEQWFGLSPDGGSGSLEVFYLFAFVSAICAGLLRSRIRSRIRGLGLHRYAAQ